MILQIKITSRFEKIQIFAVDKTGRKQYLIETENVENFLTKMIGSQKFAQSEERKPKQHYPRITFKT
ncbi:MAG: hypothetical protein AABY22_12895 [Nanoarchaeota archaeon]